MTIWSYVWSIVLGVVIGGLVTGGIVFTVEWWKNKIIANDWLICLSLEIKENLKKKIAELTFLRSHINTKYPGPVLDEGYISSFKCSFETFKSFLNNGIKLKDYELFLKYLDFISFEKSDITTRYLYMKKYKELNDEVSRDNFRNAKLFEIKEHCETQLKELVEIDKRVQRILPRQMRDLIKL